MNLKDESRFSNPMSMEDLVKMNGEAMAVMDEAPYQPIIYAVPKEWVESGKQMLELAVQFQPTLYGKISALATQEGLQHQEVQLKADLEVAKREMRNSIEALKKQDGKLKEEFFSKLSAQHTNAVKEIRDEYAKQKKENLRFLLITVASSAVLSGLVSGLFLLLGA